MVSFLAYHFLSGHLGVLKGVVGIEWVLENLCRIHEFFHFIEKLTVNVGKFNLSSL